jgi:homoserine kinase type II
MAVYTEVSDNDLEAFLAQYDLGEIMALKGIAEGVENSNFLLQTSSGSYILTLYEKRVREEDLPFFLGLMEHLKAHGISCPQPVANRTGHTLGRLCGRPAAVVSFLSGLWPKRITAEHCAELGKAMARLHLAGSDYERKRPNNLSIGGWPPLLEACEARADSVAPDLAAALKAELKDLQDHWPQDLPAGIIHADLFPDNVFFMSGRLSGLIDFYFACNDFFAYDIGICLNAWCFERDGAFNITKARKMLKSYGEVRPLSAAEFDALPILARGSALRFLLTRLYDWLHHPAGALVAPKDPLEYLARLRFHQGVRNAEAYGLDRPST